MKRRNRSLPASGAIASAFSPCRARTSRMRSSIASILMEESAMWYPSSARPSRIVPISGWSHTAVAIRPVRPRQRPRLARDLQDRRGRVLLDRRHRVRGPAETAHLRAPARDLDQQLVRQLRARRQDRRVRHLEGRRDLLARHRLLDHDLRVFRRLGARTVHRRDEEAGQPPRPPRGTPPGPGPTSAAPRSAGTRRSPSPRAKMSTKGESAAGFIRAMSPPDEQQRVALVAPLAPQRDPRLLAACAGC